MRGLCFEYNSTGLYGTSFVLPPRKGFEESCHVLQRSYVPPQPGDPGQAAAGFHHCLKNGLRGSAGYVHLSIRPSIYPSICQLAFFGLAAHTLNVRNNNTQPP